MAPALTKISKDGHVIHLSSSLASCNMDSDGADTFSIEVDPQIKLAEGSYSHKLWLNLSSLPFLNSHVFKRPLDFPDNSVLTPLLQASDGQFKTLLIPGSAPLLRFSSANKTTKAPHQVATAHPGAPDMFVVPVPEYNSHEASLQCLHSSGREAGVDGCDVPQSPHHQVGDTQPLYCPVVLTPPIAVTQKGDSVECHPRTPVQLCGSRLDPDQSLSKTLLEEAIGDQTKWQRSRQATLVSRAGRLQRRLFAMLGEHASLHCSHQLQGLQQNLQTSGYYNTSNSKPQPTAQGCSAGSNTYHTPFIPTRALSPKTDLQNFVCSSKAVLRGLQEALDSDATASSSSEEEPEQENDFLGTGRLPISERRWQEERAEVGSRWSWLQLRLAELEGRIRQLGELHAHLSCTKGGVVLAESQPLTDRQIQQTLLRETAGLSYTAGAGGGDIPPDLDNEPSSPTRLLRNIEKQSAQLSQIVNSLMSPLSLSPLSSPLPKLPLGDKGHNKRSLNSCLRGEEALPLGATKRRKMGARKRQQLIQANASCVCARTRPLLTYHKPRLYTLPQQPAPGSSLSYSLQDSVYSTSLSSSSSSCSLSSSSCPTCASCDPLTVCCDPLCSSSSSLASSSSHTRPHPVLSLSSDIPLSKHLQTALAKENWSQRPLIFAPEFSSPGQYHRLGRSSTPLHNSHGHKYHSRNRRGGVRGVSPVRWAGCVQAPYRKAPQGRRKRRHTHRVMEAEEDFLYQFSDPESSEEGTEEADTPQTSYTRKQASQGPIRRRQGESVYSIDNIVIPMSLASTTKVEKLQYKDIITPSWREIDIHTLEEKEGEDDEEVELLTDEAFAQKHQASEDREKLRWSFWGKSRRCSRSSRSGSRLSVDGLMSWECLTRGEESSAEWSSSQLDTDDQQGLEDWLPQAPWEPRIFPLSEDEEEALHSDPGESALSGWPERSRTTETSTAATAHDSISLLSQQACAAGSFSSIASSAGHIRNNAFNSKIT